MNLLYQRIDGREGISDLLRHFYADVRQFGGTDYSFMTFSQRYHRDRSSFLREIRLGTPQRPTPAAPHPCPLAPFLLTRKYLNEYNIRNTNNWHVDDSGGKDW